MIATLVIVIGTWIFTRFLRYWSDLVHESHSHPKHERTSSNSRSRTRRRSLSINLPRAVQLHTSRLRLLRGLAYAMISGILSAHSLLVAKSAVELLVRTIVDHVNQFNSYQSWLILLALVFFALSQLYYLHQGLRLCSTSVLYPFVFCIYNIIAILDGLIYFHQTSRLSTLHACLIALGTVILLTGVLALSWRLDDSAATEAQPTPLGPCLGLVPALSEDLGDSPRSPLLPTSRRRSSSSKRSRSIPPNESTPLLSNRHSLSGRRPIFQIYPPPPETSNAQHIWAELDDSNDSDGDILASLPRSIPPFLSSSAAKSRHRTRRSSLSTNNSADHIATANGLWERPSSGGGGGGGVSAATSKRSSSSGGASNSPKLNYKPPRRSQTLKERTHNERRRGSSVPSATGDIAAGSRSRSSSTTTSGGGGNKKKPPLASPAISTESDPLARTGQRHGQGHGYRDRVRGRPRSATETAARRGGAVVVVPSRWDMGRWWMGREEEGKEGEGEGDDGKSGGGGREGGD